MPNKVRTLAAETDEQREARLQRVRANQSERLAAETEEQREARLHRMHINHDERITTETEEQREVRLQRTRANQSKRLAAETEEQREARLQRDRERHREQQQPQLPLLEQPSVQAKMRKLIPFTVQYTGCTNMYHLFQTISWPQISFKFY